MLRGLHLKRDPQQAVKKFCKDKIEKMIANVDLFIPEKTLMSILLIFLELIKLNTIK
jgi:hypothetical protein